jgi:hypothetical protein
MTKKIVVFSMVVCVLQIAFVAGANAQSSSMYTGTDWKTMPDAIRSFFVIGYGHGYSRGIRLAASLKSTDGKGASAPQSAMEKLYFRLVRGGNDKIQGWDAIKDQMTLFYQDFRNTPVCWGDAELIAILSLSGGAPSDSELAAVRSEDARAGCPN